MKTVTCKRCLQPTTRNKKNGVHPNMDECFTALAKVIVELGINMQQLKQSSALNAQAASAALYVANLSR